MTKKTTHFGTKTALTSKTPAWAIHIVGVVLTLLPIVHYVVQSDPAIPDATAERIVLYADAIALAVAGIAKMFGVTYQNKE